MKETALEVARSQVEAAQTAIVELPSTAVGKQRAADIKETCYFLVHAQALEEAIARETASGGEPTSIAENNAGLLRMEYDYRTAGAAATRAMAEATKATNILNTLTVV